MPTFLTTSKMDPALAARIEASVLGQKSPRRTAARMRKTVALARLLFVLAIGVCIYNAFATRSQSNADPDRARAPARVQTPAR